jgi:ribonuclease HII
MKKYIIGIDEVGRGALAGPVVIAAAALAHGYNIPISQYRILPLRDSKKLSPKQREIWFEYFKRCPDISYAVAFVYPRQIEKRNISGAANLAALRAYKRLVSSPAKGRLGGVYEKKTPSFSPFAGGGRSHQIFLDGGLFLGSRAAQPTYAKTIVKADEKIPAVAIASIIAKVVRDRAMVRLAKRYPRYGFQIHKGYGTLIHRRAIKKHGLCAIHRKTFIKNLLKP